MKLRKKKNKAQKKEKNEAQKKKSEKKEKIGFNGKNCSELSIAPK